MGGDVSAFVFANAFGYKVGESDTYTSQDLDGSGEVDLADFVTFPAAYTVSTL